MSNARIRAHRGGGVLSSRRSPRLPEPVEAPDYGRGVRQSAPVADPHASMNSWIRARWSRSRQQAETVGGST